MRKRLAILGLAAILGSVVAAVTPAQASCPGGATTCVHQAAATGAWAFDGGAAFGAGGGEPNPWCVSVDPTCGVNSEWHQTDAGTAASCTSTSVTVGGVSFTVSSNVVNGASSPSGTATVASGAIVCSGGVPTGVAAFVQVL
jgi:hypothetical protein